MTKANKVDKVLCLNQMPKLNPIGVNCLPLGETALPEYGEVGKVSEVGRKYGGR